MRRIFGVKQGDVSSSYSVLLSCNLPTQYAQINKHTGMLFFKRA